MSYPIENALFQWEEGEERVRQADPQERRELDRAALMVADRLRGRLGGAFSIDELADLYGEGTDWVADQVQTRFSGTDSAAAVNAGFLRYASRASDYAGGRRRLREEQAAKNA